MPVYLCDANQLYLYPFDSDLGFSGRLRGRKPRVRLTDEVTMRIVVIGQHNTYAVGGKSLTEKCFSYLKSVPLLSSFLFLVTPKSNYIGKEFIYIFLRLFDSFCHGILLFASQPSSLIP